MKPLMQIFLTAMLAMVASPAQAEDWWMVAQPAGGDTALFADIDTLTRTEDGVNLLVRRIDRTGQSSDTVQQIDCDAHRTDALRRFACASEEERDNYGLILASTTPQEAAMLVFGIENKGASEFEPRS